MPLLPPATSCLVPLRRTISPAVMTELILNFAWAAIALCAFAFVPRRDRVALGAVICLVALLFPIVSVSDDLNADAATLYETFAAILASVAIIIALVAMARVFLDRKSGG